MKKQTIRIILIAIPFLIMAACTGSKKTTTSTTVAKTEETKTTPTATIATVQPAEAPPNALASAPAYPNALIGSKPGVIPPTETELNALKFKYPNLKDASLDKLKQGHFIYTQGACVKCHGADNIYRHNESDWVKIIGDMALRARLTETEKDAVFNYVIAVKTTQPK